MLLLHAEHRCSTILRYMMWPYCEYRMHVWNVLHAAGWKIQDAKITQKSPSTHHRTTLSSYVFTTLTYIDNREKILLNGNISSICPRNILNFGLLTAEMYWQFWAPQQISTGFASWLHYCSVVAQRKPTKLCTMFGCLLGWYTMYTFSAVLAP